MILLVVVQHVLVTIVKINKLVEFLIIEYQDVAPQYYYNTPEVQLVNTS